MTDVNRAETTRGGTAPGGTIVAGVLRESETWLDAQCELLSGLGTIWTDWLKRQREAINASARSLQRMFECRNLADLAQIQQQFLADSTRRSASDITSLACDSMALTSRVVGAAKADQLAGDGQSSPVRGAVRVKSSEEAPLQRAAAE